MAKKTSKDARVSFYSGHHFRTDVMTGYAIGAAIGYFIPQLHKVSQNEQLSVNYIYSGEFAGLGVAYNF
jgi:hypothetical protein